MANGQLAMARAMVGGHGQRRSGQGRRRGQWPDAVGVTAAVCAADAVVHYLSNTRSRAPVSGVAEFMDHPYLQTWYPALASKGDLSAADWSALPAELAASNVTVLPVVCVPLHDFRCAGS